MTSIKFTMSNKAAIIMKKGIMLALLAVCISFTMNITFNVFFVSAGDGARIEGTSFIGIHNSTDSGINFNFTFLEPGLLDGNNNSLQFNIANVTLNITTNTSYMHCEYSINLNGSWSPMTNGTFDVIWDPVAGDVIAGNQSFVNATPLHIASIGGIGGYNNITYRCFNESNANQTFTNHSLLRWRYKNVAPNAYAITVRSPGNGTVHSDPFTINITVNDTVRDCNIYFENGSSSNMSTPGNERREFENTSLLLIPSDFVNTPFSTNNAIWDNVTFYCQDAAGNTSWSNTTATFNNSGRTFFQIDNIAPWINTLSWRLQNKTGGDTGGNYVNVTVAVSDNSSTALGLTIRIHWDNGTVTYDHMDNVSSADVRNRSSNQTSFGFVNLTLEDVLEDGQAILEVRVNDHAQNERGGATNWTVQLWRLFEGWNYVPTFVNVSMQNVSDSVPNITYVTRFDNRAGYKNWTTFIVGGTTNANKMFNATNITGIYTSEDVLFVRDSYSVDTLKYGLESVELYQNSTTKGAWNGVVMTQRTTLNKTLWQSANWANRTVGGLAPNSNNVTWACTKNAELGRWCCAERSRRAVSCPGYYSDNYTIPFGGVVFLYMGDAVNASYNTTALWRSPI